jgi:hypothetical protein
VASRINGAGSGVGAAESVEWGVEGAGRVVLIRVPVVAAESVNTFYYARRAREFEARQKMAAIYRQYGRLHK